MKKNHVWKQRLIVGLCLAVVLLPAAALEACPSCKAALATSETGEGGDLVSGFFWSILFMLSMPFAIVTAFGISIYRATRRRGPARQTPIADAAAPPLRNAHSLEPASLDATVR